MKKLAIGLTLIATIIGGIVLAEVLDVDAENKGSYSDFYENQENGIIEVVTIPNQTTAVEIATAIAKNIVPANKMESVHVWYDTDGEAWIVTFQPSAEPYDFMLGDELNIVLSASDCRVVKIWGGE